MNPSSYMKSCPICHAQDWLTLRRYGVYSKCSSCGLVRLSVPVEEKYDSHYFLGDDGNPGHRDFNSLQAANYDKARFVPELNAFANSKGSLLDIGAAAGSFMAIARALGWEQIVGVEVSQYGQRHIANLGFHVVPDLQSLDPSLRFDLVTMHHTLEHLEDPVGTLRSVRAVLANGGRLLIEVPNWHSIHRLVSGRDWEDLRPDQHLWQYAPSTLARLVEMAGLRVEEVTTLGEPVPNAFSFLLSVGVPPRLIAMIAAAEKLIRGTPSASPEATSNPSPSGLFAHMRPVNDLVNRLLNNTLFNKRLVVVCSAD